MSLTDVYCRINRARGIELISPDDLVEAVKLTNIHNLPLIYRTYDTGLKVLCLKSLNEEQTIIETEKMVRHVPLKNNLMHV